MCKSLVFQVELGLVFDIILDVEDGVLVGGEVEYVLLIVELVMSVVNCFGCVGVCVYFWGYVVFEVDVDMFVFKVGWWLVYLMIFKL